MKLFIILALLFNMTSFAGDKLDSAHSVAVDGYINEGKIYSTTQDTYSLKRQVKEQLMYVIGQLNGLSGGSPDMSKTKIEITNVVPSELYGFEATYKARLFIAWPREYQIPNSYELILPASGSWQALQNFYEEFGDEKNYSKNCLDWSAHDVSSDIFWYYYRPAKRSCPLTNVALDKKELVVRLPVYLKYSRQNTSNKSPEYEKVWEDNRLVATTIFGMAEKETASNSDAGVVAFAQTVRSLVATFGTPKYSNLEGVNLATFRNGMENREVHMIFDIQNGELDVALYIVDDIKNVYSSDPEFIAKYNKRTQISDFISYSGHSGLGANIRTLARMGQFSPGQYQLFLVNGCDTFAYVDDALRDAHLEVNPGFGPDKFLDIITNAMPSYFHMNERSNLAIIKALAKKEKTYRQILAEFDQNQRAVVTGEQDNSWPAPFTE